MNVTTLAQLEVIIAAGELHHCTVRDPGRMFEALHVYVRDENGFRGFRHVGSIAAYDLNAPRDDNGKLKSNSEYNQAIDATKGNWNLGNL